jgi:hypothetical protein
MKLECTLCFADGASVETSADISGVGELADESSQLHGEAREFARELLSTYPGSIVVIVGAPEQGAAVVFPRPDSLAAREFVSSLQDKAVRAGKVVRSGPLDA